jgi:hypothetical protein
MNKKQKRWSEMTTEELAAATKEFDDPNYDPPARTPTQRELAKLDRVQRRSVANRFRIGLVLEKKLVEATDNYAATHGITFSEVVADALRKLMGKSA